MKKNLNLPGWLQSYQYEYDILNCRIARNMVEAITPFLAILPMIMGANYFMVESKRILKKIEDATI